MEHTIQDLYNTLFTKDTQYNYNTHLLRKLQDFLSQQEDNKEVWKAIQGYNGWYYVSTCGNVLSLKQKEPIVLKPQNTGKGYYYVDLEGKQCKIHRLVANAFLQNPDKKPVVHHRDGNKHNNRLENLQFATYKENSYYYQKEKKENAQIVLSAVSADCES